MKLAVSSCLLGNNIRYNGGHKKDRFITDTLSQFCDFVPFCPEDLAFGTPRDAMRLVEDKQKQIHVKTVNNDKDITAPLLHECANEVSAIKNEPVCGIIFQAKSPSCGFGSAKTYLENGYSSGKTDGMMVKTCKEAFGNMPMEEEARLNDPWLRENFIMQVFAYDAVQNLRNNAGQMKTLVDFHTRYKYLLLSKDEARYRKLGRIVANKEQKEFTTLLNEYSDLFTQTIAVKSKIAKTINVLQHMAGFFKNNLNAEEKTHLHGLITQYDQKIIPLITVVEVIKLYAHKYDSTYLLGQIFLDPYPASLALRSEIKGGK